MPQVSTDINALLLAADKVAARAAMGVPSNGDAVLTAPQTLTPQEKTAVRGNIGVDSPIRIIGCVGDSITYAGGDMIYFSTSWAVAMRTALGGRIDFVGRAGFADFALGGVRASQMVPGGSQRAIFEAALASSADTLMICIGANDLTVDPNATIIANVASLWDEALAAGKRVVAMDLPSCKSVRIDASQAAYKAAQTAVNIALYEAAMVRGLVYVDFAHVCDDNNDGYSDDKYLQDDIHPNLTGAYALGQYAAEVIRPHVQPQPAILLPSESSTRWITTNPFNRGTIGSGNVATGITKQDVGGASTVTNLVKRGVGQNGNWQEFVATGVTDLGVLLSIPTSYARCYRQNATATFTAGKKYRCVAEYEVVEGASIYSLGLMLLGFGGIIAAGDSDPNGNLVTVTAKGTFTNGILASPVWTAPATVTINAVNIFTIYGNGTVRLGRNGIFLVD